MKVRLPQSKIFRNALLFLLYGAVALLRDQELTYTLTVATNVGPDSPKVVTSSDGPGKAERSELDLQLSWPGWPQGVYSLSHIALPFSPNDPLYGDVARVPG